MATVDMIITDNSQQMKINYKLHTTADRLLLRRADRAGNRKTVERNGPLLADTSSKVR